MFDRIPDSFKALMHNRFRQGWGPAVPNSNATHQGSSWGHELVVFRKPQTVGGKVTHRKTVWNFVLCTNGRKFSQMVYSNDALRLKRISLTARVCRKLHLLLIKFNKNNFKTSTHKRVLTQGNHHT